jgi:hypothetical protein
MSFRYCDRSAFEIVQQSQRCLYLATRTRIACYEYSVGYVAGLLCSCF